MIKYYEATYLGDHYYDKQSFYYKYVENDLVGRVSQDGRDTEICKVKDCNFRTLDKLLAVDHKLWQVKEITEDEFNEIVFWVAL